MSKLDERVRCRLASERRIRTNESVLSRKRRAEEEEEDDDEGGRSVGNENKMKDDLANNRKRNKKL